MQIHLLHLPAYCNWVVSGSRTGNLYITRLVGMLRSPGAEVIDMWFERIYNAFGPAKGFLDLRAH
eukprot:3513353-Amphidinium_carterae.1